MSDTPIMTPLKEDVPEGMSGIIEQKTLPSQSGS